MYSIGKFAEMIGKSISTLRRWDADGQLVAHRAHSKHRYYTHDQYLEYLGLTQNVSKRTVAYIRVSSHNQKDDLKNQRAYISDFCRSAGIAIDDWYEDVGSGLNFKRKHFKKLMEEVEDGKVETLVLAHKDRLVRFGYDWFRDFCDRHGCSIKLINDDRLSPEEEIVKDLVTIIHVFSSRVYGLRKYKQQVKTEA